MKAKYSKFETLLKNSGITAYKVGKDLNISTSTFYEWKVGNYTPKIDKLQKVAEYFHVPVDYFLK